MDELTRKAIVSALRDAFGAAMDVTPGEGQPLLVLLPALVIPPPWEPCPMRALTRWPNWPQVRPEFFIGEDVANAERQPPRSSTPTLLLGETWRSFSFQFPWSGSDPARAIQLWLTRFQEAN